MDTLRISSHRLFELVFEKCGLAPAAVIRANTGETLFISRHVSEIDSWIEVNVVLRLNSAQYSRHYFLDIAGMCRVRNQAIIPDPFFPGRVMELCSFVDYPAEAVRGEESFVGRTSIREDLDKVCRLIIESAGGQVGLLEEATPPPAKRKEYLY